MKCSSFYAFFLLHVLQNLSSSGVFLNLPVSSSSGNMPQRRRDMRLPLFRGRLAFTSVPTSVKSLPSLYVLSFLIFSAAHFHFSLHFLRNLHWMGSRSYKKRNSVGAGISDFLQICKTSFNQPVAPFLKSHSSTYLGSLDLSMVLSLKQSHHFCPSIPFHISPVHLCVAGSGANLWTPKKNLVILF